MMGELRQSHKAHGMLHASADLGRMKTAVAQAERDIVPDRQPRKAGILLEHDANALRYNAAHPFAFKGHIAFARLEYAGNDIEECGLPAAGRPDYRKEFALSDVEIDMLKGPHRAAADHGLENMPYAAQHDRSLATAHRIRRRVLVCAGLN